jgi:uncharacterized protein YegJ (DUF2314 family)
LPVSIPLSNLDHGIIAVVPSHSSDGGFAMGLWAWIKNLLGGKSRDDSESDKPIISLVLLLREPRYLDDKILAQQAGKAWHKAIDAGETEDPQDFVVGASPTFVLKCGGRVFLVHNFGKPYMDDPKKAAEDIQELRLRKCVSEHRAWLSVDALGEFEGEDLDETYRRIGKLAAALADTDCLAIYAPGIDRLNVYDAELDEKLRGPNALDAFGRSPFVPVVPVTDKAPLLEKAATEARRRWPEFVAAFEQRGPDQLFSVKSRFEDGEAVEFMWAEVTGIENGVIYGKLGNDPVDMPRLRLGSPVQVKVEEIQDWVYTKESEMVGGFSVKILMEGEK